MNVLFLHTPIAASLGADTWVHVQIASALDRTDHRVLAACVEETASGPTPTSEAFRSIGDVEIMSIFPGPQRPRRWSVRSVLQIAYDSLGALYSLVVLVRLVRRHHIDIIHTSDRPRDAVAAVLLAKLTGATSIVHVHVLYRDWMGRSLRWAIANADARIAVSEFVRDSLVEAGLPASSTFTVLNAVDVERWHPGNGRTDARHDLSIDASVPVVLTVCRLFPEKGVAELIAAMTSVVEAHPSVRLLIAGEDTDIDQPFRRQLDDQVRKLGLGEHVRFLGRRSDIPALMAASDVFAMPSFEEPFGLVFGEAMAMEIPVVALDNGGTIEVVEHATSGLLSPASDVAAIAENIITLLDDPSLRRRLGVAGRERVLASFNVPRMADEVADVYRRIS